MPKRSVPIQNELNMMHSGDEDIELCSVDSFGSIEPNRNFYKKNTKIIKKYGKVHLKAWPFYLVLVCFSDWNMILIMALSFETLSFKWINIRRYNKINFMTRMILNFYHFWNYYKWVLRLNKTQMYVSLIFISINLRLPVPKFKLAVHKIGFNSL